MSDVAPPAVPDGPSVPDTAEGRAPWTAADWACLGIVAAVLLLPLAGLLRYQGPPMEEGFMLTFPERLLRGDYPHRDFLHLYGPGSLWVLAAVYKVFGVDLTVERLVGLVQHALVAFGLFAVLRPWGRRVATAGAVVSVVVLIGPLGLSAMAWNGALALGVWGVAVGGWALRCADARRARRLAAASGLLFAGALLYRPDMVLAVGLAGGAILLGLPAGRRRPLVLGLGGGLLLYVPHLLLAGPAAAFRGMFLEPVVELRAGRALPVPPSWGTTDGFLQRAGELRVTGWPFPMLPVPNQIFLWFFLVPLSCGLVLWVGWRLRRSETGSARATSYWPAALFGAALFQQAVQRPDTAHLSWVTGITFPLCVAAVAWLVARARPRLDDGRAQLAGIASVALVLLLVIPFYPVRTYVDLVGQSFGHNRFGFPVTHDGRTFYFGSREGASDAQAVVDALSAGSSAGQRLVVGTSDLSRTNYSDAFFYYLFPELVPGTRYIEMDPVLADGPDSALPDELRRNDWLILSSAWKDWTEPNESANGRSQAANRVVAQEYCPVRTTPTFSLYRRRAAGEACPAPDVP
ncbi:MAG: hypothetical protein ACKO04_00790 [Actinomycetes bacterium]